MSDQVTALLRDWYHPASLRTKGDKIVTVLGHNGMESGSLFLSAEATNNYMKFTAMAFGFFAMLWVAMDVTFKTIGAKFYVDSSTHERVLLRSTIMGNIHHVIVFWLSTYYLAFSCADQSSLVTDSTWSTFRFFSSAICASVPDTTAASVICFSIGYFLFDLFTIAFLYEERTSTQTQYLYHHMISLAGLFGGFVSGFGQLNLGSLIMLIEISTVFLNLRDIFPKEDRNCFWAQVNQYTFFVSFTIMRMIILPYIIQRTYVDIVQFWRHRSVTARCTSCFSFVMLMSLYILNLYWYTLIIKGLIKLLRASGVLPPLPEKESKVSDTKKEA